MKKTNNVLAWLKPANVRIQDLEGELDSAKKEIELLQSMLAFSEARCNKFVSERKRKKFCEDIIMLQFEVLKVEQDVSESKVVRKCL